MFSALIHFDSFKNRKDKLSFVDIVCEQIRERVTCVRCKDLLMDPRQSQCGCRFCYGCIGNLEGVNLTTCPGCGESVGSMKEKFCVDRAIEREIMGLPMNCINMRCGNKCELRNLGKHLNVCEYREEACARCCETVVYKDLEQHRVVDCKMIEVKCRDCGLEMTKEDLEKKHLNVAEDLQALCEKWTAVCPYGCSDRVHVSIKVHLGSCVSVPVECPMKVAGCPEKLSRLAMVEHMSTGMSSHIRLMLGTFKQLSVENTDMKSKFSLQSQAHDLEIEQLRKTIQSNVLEVTLLESKLVSCERAHDLLRQEAAQFRGGFASAPKCGEYTWTLEDIGEKIEDAKKGKNVQITSESFYTNVPGYNVSLKIYPNGDGSACGSSLSIYFVITKGKYDDQISWPFQHKVSLSLLKDASGTLDRTINMRPDSNVHCYGKPNSQYNLAAGQPNFISQKDLFKITKSSGRNSISVFVKVS